MSEKKFIIWDPKDNYRPRFDDDGNIISCGLIGVVGEDNVYLTAYPDYQGNSKRPKDLEVNEVIRGVRYSLSGSTGIYDIYRVS